MHRACVRARVRVHADPHRRVGVSCLARLARSPEPFDVEAGVARFDAAFEGRLAA